MDEMNEVSLYNEIKGHPQCKRLKSTHVTNSNQTQIRGTNQGKRQYNYIYAHDPKYELGRGSFGQVFVCFYEGDPPLKLALKIIEVPEQYEQIKTIEHIVSTSRQQILALIKLRKNKNIIRIQDVIRQKQHIYMLLQFCNDKDMVSFFGKLWREKRIIRQVEVLYYFNQVLNAFKSLHQHSFVHRDIKPSNILVKNGVLKVADFGLARQIFEERQSLQEHVGTIITAAPQIVFKQEYSNKCDIYSLGVIFYWMMYQKYPFDAKVPTREDFTQNKLNFPKANYVKVSPEAEDLIRQMMAYQEVERINWKELFDHPLFHGYNIQIFNAIDQEIKAQYDNSLYNLRQTYGRKIVDDIQEDNQLLDIEIPRSYYKFLKQIEGEDQYNKYLNAERQSLTSSPGIAAHIQIKNEYKNQNIRIKFFRMIISELKTFQIGPKSQNRGQMILIRDLIVHGIQNYIMYILNRVKNQLLSIDPATIFKVSTLQEAKKTSLHKNFEQMVTEKVRGSEFFTGTKLTEAQIARLKQKTEQYQITEQSSLLFSLLHQGLISEFLNQLNGCIIEFVYFLKPWIFKMSRKGKMEKDVAKLRAVILLVHHLFMFSMENEVFPDRYNDVFDYQNFLEDEQFKETDKFNKMNSDLLKLLSRFE